MCLLYEAEMKERSPSEVLVSLMVPPDPFVAKLVRGVESSLERVDALISEASVGWGVDRMPVVDRSTLRIAVYELCEELSTPVAVVIDEAVELVKAYSTEDSGRFVNGVLSAVATKVRGPKEGA